MMVAVSQSMPSTAGSKTWRIAEISAKHSGGMSSMLAPCSPAVVVVSAVAVVVVSATVVVASSTTAVA